PTQEEMDAFFESHSLEIEQCYIAGTYSNPKLKGEVRVTFTLSPRGDVTDIFDDDSAIADVSVVECVMDVVSSLSYPSGGTSPQEYTHTFHFGQDKS
ncbi:MAG: AgmX/PglI C-terminal domain-containing protein, partial [Polyangiaceae bacterium]|nr:AgmX/PglI C-terminal domain-containing protein [Polyangiaceae bacterium]